MAAYEELKQVKEGHKQNLLGLPNVVGVGVGYKESRGTKTDEMCVVVLVSRKLPRAALTAQDLVPKDMAGARTDVLEVGELRALQARTDRWRPAPPGVSIGHYQITAGTFGAVVRDRATGARLILSNNHVLANSNNANPGDPVLQPGPADGGTTRNDTIAQLERFCPIQFGNEPGGDCSLANSYTRFGNFIAELMGSSYRLATFISNPQATNLVDAAVARPADDSSILEDILEIGPVAGTKPASLGMSVRKSGRTTEFTSGEVNVLDASVSISYGTSLTATFEGQIVTSAMSQGGDSGSLLVDGTENKAVGLLFAGSNQSTIHNPIQAVLDCLEVDL
jgi:hypothetical protein